MASTSGGPSSSSQVSQCNNSITVNSEKQKHHTSAYFTHVDDRKFYFMWEFVEFSDLAKATEADLLKNRFFKATVNSGLKRVIQLTLWPNGNEDGKKGQVALEVDVQEWPEDKVKFSLNISLMAKDGSKVQLGKTHEMEGFCQKYHVTQVVPTKKLMNTKHVVNDKVMLEFEFIVHNGIKHLLVGRSDELLDTDDEEDDMSEKEAALLEEHDKIFEEGRFSDFSIVASCGQEFKVNRCMLFPKSEYFQVLLRNESCKEYIEKKVVFKDISAPTILTLLRHIYIPGLAITHEQITPELMTVVQRLFMLELDGKIEKFLNELYISDIVDYLLLVEKAERPDFTELLMTLLAKNKNKVLRTKSWHDLQKRDEEKARNIMEEVSKILSELSAEAITID